MDCFKHCVLLTDVCAARSTYAALEFSSFVGDDVAVKIGKNENFEVGSSFFINKLCGCDINIPFVCSDFGVILSNLLAKVKEFTVSCFNDVCFCDN